MMFSLLINLHIVHCYLKQLIIISLHFPFQEREVERNKLWEQLQKLSSPGLPSRVLDGRPVIRKETQAAGGSSGRGHEPHWDKVGSPGPRGADEVLVLQSLQNQIDQLSREKEAIQHSLEGDKMVLQAEVERQREAITKLKERKEDLTQNLAVLTYENSHQNGNISMLKEDNFMLHTSLDTSMRQVWSQCILPPHLPSTHLPSTPSLHTLPPLTFPPHPPPSTPSSLHTLHTFPSHPPSTPSLHTFPSHPPSTPSHHTLPPHTGEVTRGVLRSCASREHRAAG